MLVLAIAVGLALRIGYASSAELPVGEWETDGFVTVWEGRPWGSLNRVRAPGLALLLTQLGEVLPVDSLRNVRLLAIGLSGLGFLAALLCAAALAAISGLSRRSMLRAASWMAWLWAVHPTLILSSVSPTPELITGSMACLMVAALAFARHRPGVLSSVLCALAGGAFVVAGGVLAAVALVVGVLVWLMPIPPFGRMLAGVTILVLALASGWAVQRGSDGERPWFPDTAWAYSWSAMVDHPGPHPNDIPTDADQRARLALSTAWDATTQSDGVWIGQTWLNRLAFQLMGPRRFEYVVQASGLGQVDLEALEQQEPGASAVEASSQALARGRFGLGLFDVFLRGGLLLFALTVIGLVRKGAAPASWPRAGVVVGALTWLLLMAASAIGPAAMAPFDVLLLGVAGAGVAGADPKKAWTRRLAFAVGGVLLGTFLWTSGWRDEPLQPWLMSMEHRTAEGRSLTHLLEDGGPKTPDELFRAAHLMSVWNAPLLRLPEAAYERASESWKSVMSTETADQAVELLVRTLVECRLYADAARLADDYHMSLGVSDKRSELLLHWVQGEQRKSENLPIRRP